VVDDLATTVAQGVPADATDPQAAPDDAIKRLVASTWFARAERPYHVVDRACASTVLDAKRRQWGDVVQTGGSAWRHLRLPVDAELLRRARAWAVELATEGLHVAMRPLTSVLRTSGDAIAEGRARRATQAVRTALEALAVARDTVAWVGPGADASLSAAAFRCAQGAVTVLVRQFDSYVCHQGRNEVMAHFELVLKAVEAVKRCVTHACKGSTEA
jgi:hypothetical protein